MPSVAVIGAGISGLATAQRLSQRLSGGITVIEWGRGPGGRTARKRVQTVDGSTEMSFDHACPFIDSSSETFMEWLPAESVERWNGMFALCDMDTGSCTDESERHRGSRFVATPASNDICKALAKSVESSSSFGEQSMVYGTQALSASFEPGHGWRVKMQARGGDEEVTEALYDGLVLSDKLLLQPNRYQVLQEGPASPLYVPQPLTSSSAVVLMVAFSQPPVSSPWDVVDFSSSSASATERVAKRLVHESSKPSHDNGSGTDRWVLHATPEFARSHFVGENLDDEEEVKREMLDAFDRTFRVLHGVENVSERSIYASIFPWDMAQPVEEQRFYESFLIDTERRAGVCGDFFVKQEASHGVEAAALSGQRLGDALASELASRSM